MRYKVETENEYIRLAGYCNHVVGECLHKNGLTSGKTKTFVGSTMEQVLLKHILINDCRYILIWICSKEGFLARVKSVDTRRTESKILGWRHIHRLTYLASH